MHFPSAPEIADRVGLPRRLGAIAYDALIVTALLWAVSLPTGGLDLDQPGAARVLYQLGLIATGVLYFIGFWKWRAATVGMRAWGICVVDGTGGPISWGQSLLRAGSAVVSAAALGLGFWWCLLRSDRSCWHDCASRTRLVRC